ncbi:hypothetical protein OF83DRAFT_1165091 [Amylostereum chailletii]|nr:hypothetical protein OF83DRAFT_1165091 [Amylostereum chailletii]
MPSRHISCDIKECILWLNAHGHLTEDLADLFDVSEWSIRRWRDNLEEYGDVIPPLNPLRGQPPILSGEQVQGDWPLISYDISMSRTALHRIIQDCAFTYKTVWRAAAERDEVARAEHAAFIKNNILASMAICVDETSKDNRTIYHHHGPAPRGQTPEIDVNFV